MINYVNLDKTQEFKNLKNLKPFDVRNINSERISSCVISEAGDLKYCFGSMPVDKEITDALQSLADKQQVIEKYKDLLSGSIVNTGEKRKVLHHLTRGLALPSAEKEVKEHLSFYQAELEKIKIFSNKIRNENKFKHVVQIGIGGSDLGPRALCYALNLCQTEKKLDARFLSNVDPDDAATVLQGLDLEKTLFILVSKSGTTQETLTNRDLVFNEMKEKGITDPLSHMVAVTSSTSPLAKLDNLAGLFFMDDFIGGRYSSTSAVGGLILSLTYGFDVFEQLLKGAHDEDVCAFEPNIYKNGALMDAMIGVYLRNVMDIPYTAVLPYSQALNRFPAHLQQLDMESNGKSVNRDGQFVSYKTGPVIFGEPGTNGQHSFYQLLHQGTDVVPMQFIGFKENQGSLDSKIDNFTSRQKLNANLTAQIVAFACGKENKENSNKHFSGNRPSSLLVSEKLTPYSLGSLLSHFENKVMFQGFIWNINSFDQEGVQLGKILAKKVLNGCEGDENLMGYASLLGL